MEKEKLNARGADSRSNEEWDAMHKEKSLDEEIIETCIGNYVPTDKLREAVLKILDRIRLSPNRDDKIVPIGKHKLKLGILDGGGIGKQEVKNIIKEEIGGELSNES